MPSDFRDEKLPFEPPWAQDGRNRSLVRRRLMLGRGGWLLAFLLACLLLWRVKMQEQEMDVLLRRLELVEEAEQEVFGARPFQRILPVTKEGPAALGAVVGEKVEGLGREDGLGVPKSLGGDGGGDNVDIRGASNPLSAPTRPAANSTESHSWAHIQNLFVFGDSYTETGATHEESSPPDDNPLDEDGRFSISKPVWIDFVTQIYNHTPYRTSNFAVGGSTVDEDVVAPFLSGSSLKAQMRKYFLPRYSFEQTGVEQFWTSSDSLFIIWLGVNDVAMHYGRNPSPEAPTVPINEVFDSYLTRILTLYDTGARNFLFITVPPFDRSLKVPQTGDEYERRLQMIEDIGAYNAHVFEMVEHLKNTFGTISEDEKDGVEVHVFDAHRLYVKVLENPQSFGQTKSITDTRSICQEVEL